jgi:pyruvate dehydrogenase E2 component (dihydrolipoamide acetyltransferase)
MKEGKVVSWLKAEGDAISAGEAIMVVESDKADMDVEAFEDGYLAAIITGEGESGVVGAPVALIAQNEADIPALQVYAASLSGAAPIVASAPPAVQAASSTTETPPKPAAASHSSASTGGRVVASPLARSKAAELGIELSSITGTGPEGRITASDVETAAKGGGNAPKKSGSAAASSPTKPSWTPAPGVIAATPTARALAKKAKMDLSKIVGTGEFGRVTADDVRIATGEKEPVRAKKAGTTVSAVEMPEGIVPMTGMQRAVSNNMVATLTIPEFRVSRDIIMDDFDNLYQKLKPSGVSVSAMLAKAVALAIEKHPIINSGFSPESGGSIVYKKDINIAMAVAIDGGLITPTLTYANERTVVDLAENWKELVDKAKKGTLSPAEYNSGTFTISNMGMFGVTNFGAILPQGQGGILAIGGTQEVIVPDSQAVLGMKKVKKMTVTLTCDHRQIYGADAALFLKTLAGIMESNVELLSR